MAEAVSPWLRAAAALAAMESKSAGACWLCAPLHRQRQATRESANVRRGSGGEFRAICRIAPEEDARPGFTLRNLSNIAGNQTSFMMQSMDRLSETPTQDETK